MDEFERNDRLTESHTRDAISQLFQKLLTPKMKVVCHVKQLVLRDYLVIVICVFVLYTLSPHRFASRYSYIRKKDIESSLLEQTSGTRNFSATELCEIHQVVQQNRDVPLHTWSSKIENLAEIEVGGESIPKDCHPRFSVAILVPYRNRPGHLDTFLTFFHNYLQQQRLHYRIFVIEQFDEQPFNRGKLFNIGSQYAAKFGFPCLVLHDVDLIPMNLGNIFACSRDARHLSSSLDSFRFNLPYPELFGGAVTITAENFRKVNGFSNMFQGWGGEDDDFYERIVHQEQKICRFPPQYSRYTMLKHAKEEPSKDRNELLRSGYLRYSTDGLNSLLYEQRALISRPLFTHILART